MLHLCGAVCSTLGDFIFCEWPCFKFFAELLILKKCYTVCGHISFLGGSFQDKVRHFHEELRRQNDSENRLDIGIRVKRFELLESVSY